MLGMHLMLMIGKLGQYKSDLPDFMVFLGHTAAARVLEALLLVPLRRCAMVVVVPAVAGLRLRLPRLPLADQGRLFLHPHPGAHLRRGAHVLPQRHDHGRQQRLHRLQFILGADIRTPGDQARALHRHRRLAHRSSIAVCRWLTRPSSASIQRAIRDSENRVLFSGYAAANFKLFVFVALRRHRRARRRALRPAGRHHQPERDDARRNPSKPWSGSPSADAAPWSARSSARSA